MLAPALLISDALGLLIPDSSGRSSGTSSDGTIDYSLLSSVAGNASELGAFSFSYDYFDPSFSLTGIM